MRRCAAMAALIFAAWAMAGAWQEGHAESSAWSSAALDAKAAPARLRLLSGGVATSAPKALLLGLEFELLKGWKVYWRTPGDAGYPPEIDWTGSENLTAPRMRWPAPERFHVLGLETLGYRDAVLFPIEARLQEVAGPVRLRAKISYLVCDEICIPGEAALALDIPEAGLRPGAATPQRTRIQAALARVPGDGQAAGLAIEGAEVAEDSGLLSVTVRAAAPLHAPDLYVEGPEGFFFTAPTTHFWDGKRRAIFRMDVEGGALMGGEGGALMGSKGGAAAILGQKLRFTLVDDLGRASPRAMEAERVVVPAAASPLAGKTFIAVLLLAVLGGLILNLMPCVLPVLSLKLLTIAGHGGAPRAVVRRNFLATSAGILFAFLVLATLIFFLRGAGQAVGWGFQFQAPIFLLFMLALLTLFAANLWGLFAIRLPVGVQSFLATRGHGEGSAANFLTGIFATILATPCSAPFLGTSIGFALSRGAVEIYAVFTALGVGLALPYLAVVLFPGLASRLPKPGNWMIHLRRVLGLALLATAIWLLTVLAGEVGAAASFGVGALMAALLLAIGLGRRFPRFRRPLGALALLCLGLALPVTLHGTAPSEAEIRARLLAEAGIWQPFDQAAIPALVADGKRVFVDVTADWCITCQANKAIVLDRGEVAEALRAEDVVAMRADWTRPDERIAAYLAQFGRFGIPFNAVYGPEAPAGIPLPELLSQKAVLDAMRRAGPKE